MTARDNGRGLNPRGGTGHSRRNSSALSWAQPANAPIGNCFPRQHVKALAMLDGQMGNKPTRKSAGPRGIHLSRHEFAARLCLHEAAITSSDLRPGDGALGLGGNTRSSATGMKRVFHVTSEQRGRTTGMNGWGDVGSRQSREWEEGRDHGAKKPAKRKSRTMSSVGDTVCKVQ